MIQTKNYKYQKKNKIFIKIKKFKSILKRNII